MAFKEISIEDLSFNPFTKIGKGWFLITSGTKKNFNTMTASWGFMGFMWGKCCHTAMVRPNRYTFKFMEENALYTISYFSEEYRDALKFCGSHSGRDCDKMAKTGLKPMFIDGTTSFEQADLIFVCRKIYNADMDNERLIPELQGLNEKDPIHKQYIGEILKVYQKI